MKHLIIILFSVLIFVSCDTKETIPELLEKTANTQFFVPENIYASSVRVAYFDSISKIAPENQKERNHLKKHVNFYMRVKPKMLFIFWKTYGKPVAKVCFGTNWTPMKRKVLARCLPWHICGWENSKIASIITMHRLPVLFLLNQRAFTRFRKVPEMQLNFMKNF